MSDTPDEDNSKRKPLSDRRTIASKFDKNPENQPTPKPAPITPPITHFQEGFSIGNTRPKEAKAPDPDANKTHARVQDSSGLSGEEPRRGRDLLREAVQQAEDQEHSMPTDNLLEGDSAWERGRPVLMVCVFLAILAGVGIFAYNRLTDQSQALLTDAESESASLVSRPTASRASGVLNPAVAQIEDNTAALGGYERLKRLAAVSMHGEMKLADRTIPFSLYGRRPDYYRITYDLPDNTQLIIGFDGKNAWQELKKHGASIQVSELDPALNPSLMLNVDFDLPPQKYLLTGEYSKDRQSVLLNADSLTRDVFAGETYDVYKIHEKGRPTTTCYQDMSSNLIAYTVTRLNGVEHRIAYDDYRKVDGVYVSHRRKLYLDDELQADVLIKDIEFNPGILIGLFQQPTTRSERNSE
ncbi:hypothetical protein [Cerasicoccus frondis]|uniref:hypothetical protein n=1 Tax=Cerasicoccus frondis TaxID=490090 RepID=UPI002852B8C7|nr:hypothetical protein [Cerasicoccus frondis]